VRSRARRGDGRTVACPESVAQFVKDGRHCQIQGGVPMAWPTPGGGSRKRASSVIPRRALVVRGDGAAAVPRSEARVPCRRPEDCGNLEGCVAPFSFLCFSSRRLVFPHPARTPPRRSTANGAARRRQRACARSSSTGHRPTEPRSRPAPERGLSSSATIRRPGSSSSCRAAASRVPTASLARRMPASR
jgi:hypothetical protein